MTNTETAAPALTIRRTFNAPRERVFAAFTDAELLREWHGLLGGAMGNVSFDARPGGKYRIEMRSADGEEYNVGGVISEFRPPELLAYTFRWEEDDPQLERDTYVRVEFIAKGEQTEIVFTHTAFSGIESRDRHNEGWNDLFGRLDAMLVPPVRINGIDLSGYMVKDAPRAIAWYRTVLGLEPSMIYPEDRGAEYELPDGTVFGLWGGGGKVMPFQPSNGILFAVDDLDAALTQLAPHGIPVQFRSETPNCYLAMISDSEGNSVTLHQRKAR
jgi:uncharacterized protein YndB with AHSA1/START domain/predicted enzyme related to lactoylglutathione lyase